MGYKFDGGFKNGGGEQINVRMELLSFKEDDNFIVYSPSLDITGYGKDGQEAQKSFVIALEEFLKYTLNKKTLFLELERLGWKKVGPKKKPRYEPPYLDTLFGEREYLKDIIREKDYVKNTEQLLMPVM